MNKLVFIALTVFLGFIIPVQEVSSQTSTDFFLGEWVVESMEAPHEYSKGALIISEHQGQMTGKVRFPDNRELSVRELKIKDNKLVFNVMIEGYSILVDLTREGDKMTGKAETPDGIVKIKTEKLKK